MTLLFICGSLEQGKDGVGDYTRRLAGELIRQGKNVALLAVFDKGVEKASTEKQYDQLTPIPTYRLPHSILLKQKKQLAKLYIEQFNPEWLSLQYVPFSFDDKGLPFRWSHVFRELGKDRKWQILFHELWVGRQGKNNLKTSILKSLQQNVITRLIKNCRPELVHTQSKTNEMALHQLNISASVLPLFSNIPLCKSEVEKEEEYLTLASFGILRECKQVRALLKEFKLFAQEKKRKARLLILGKSGALKKEWIRICEQNSIAVKVVNHLTPEEVSRRLQLADIGITTLSMNLVDKSGSVAALLSHSLPVLCLTPLQSAFGITANPAIAEYKQGRLAAILAELPQNVQGYSLSDIALKFQEDLLQTQAKQTTLP
ncbi:MAG: hypothetical protein AAGG68_13975 [Bacteroidota bacterium]